MEEYGSWLPWVDDIFTPLIDSETGDFRSYPWSGSYMEQPYPGMTVLRIIQGEYKKVKAEAKAKFRNMIEGGKNG